MSLASTYLFLFAVAASGQFFVRAFIVNPGPKVIPTKGHPWPLPKQWNANADHSFYTVNPHHFIFESLDGPSCKILENATLRYTKIINDMGLSVKNGVNHWMNSLYYQGNVTKLQIVIENFCQSYPHLEMDESYTLDINDNPTLRAPQIWGILRGLETFTHLIYLSHDGTNLLINASEIVDEPLYPHRGLMLDTSRHFIQPETIKAILDGMSYNKLNVFHWHLVDDQSFPFVSAVYPELSNGAFKPEFTYSPDTVQEIIEYARLRGIRVIPEFDSPGHTRSWGVSHIELLTPCHGKYEGYYGPMDPTKNHTFQFITNLFREVKATFQDDFMHLGADEVDFDCWSSNPNIVEYMKKQGYGKDYAKLQNEFVSKVIDSVLDMEATPIVWEEAFSSNLSPNAIVHVWKRTAPMDVMKAVTQAGYKGILSTGWYLDRVQFQSDILDYLKNDPRGFEGTEAQKMLVLGGEACMWSELVDDDNVLQRIFSRVAATAERLWSHDFQNMDYALQRIEEQNCRLRQRGIRTQPPNGPGFC